MIFKPKNHDICGDIISIWTELNRIITSCYGLKRILYPELIPVWPFMRENY